MDKLIKSNKILLAFLFGVFLFSIVGIVIKPVFAAAFPVDVYTIPQTNCQVRITHYAQVQFYASSQYPNWVRPESISTQSSSSTHRTILWDQPEGRSQYQGISWESTNSWQANSSGTEFSITTKSEGEPSGQGIWQGGFKVDVLTPGCTLNGNNATQESYPLQINSVCSGNDCEVSTTSKWSVGVPPTPTQIPTSTPTPSPIPTPTTIPPTTIPTATLTPTPTPPLVGDVDRNGCVGIIDFTLWLFAYQRNTVQVGTYPDVDGNGTVNLLDYNLWFQKMLTLPTNLICASAT